MVYQFLIFEIYVSSKWAKSVKLPDLSPTFAGRGILASQTCAISASSIDQPISESFQVVLWRFLAKTAQFT